MKEEQRQYLKENYATIPNYLLSEQTGLTIKQITTFAYNNSLKKEKNARRRKRSDVSYEQIDYIIDNFNLKTNQEIAEYLHLSTDIISSVGRNYNLKRTNPILNYAKNLSPYQKQFILDNYSTMTTLEISEQIQISPDNIRSYAYAHGVKRDRTVVSRNYITSKLSSFQKDYIRENYTSKTNKEIASALDIEESMVHGYASNNNLTKSQEGRKFHVGYWEELLRDKDNAKECYWYKQTEPVESKENLYLSKYGKYRVNQNYFSVINNEWKAYWLGFLFADGSLSENRKSVALGLKKEDLYHVEKFKKSLQTDAPVKIYDTNYIKLDGNKAQCAKISISNQKIFEDLCNLGCTPNKTFKISFPNIKREFFRDFIRGYFDGDGCIHINIKKKIIRFSLLGTESILKSISDIFCEELNINQKSICIEEGKKIGEYRIGNIYDIEKIFTYLYKDSNIFLERKYNKFNEIYRLDKEKV